MSEEATFTMKLDPELHADFVAEAEAADRSASQVVRELMHDFIERQREARAYDAFLEAKVAAARTSMREEGGVSNDEVETLFALRRSKATPES